MRTLNLTKMDYKEELEFIRNSFKDYITKSGLKSVVLGVSGGIDSALIAAIIAPSCRELGIKFIGVSLPGGSNKADEIERANMIGESFCDEYSEKSIEGIMAALQTEMLADPHPSSIEDKIRLGNMKARTRMILLYDMAQKNNGLVMSTDNLTELFLGFWTLHGDVGDFGLIQNLWKTDVYNLARYIDRTELGGHASDALRGCITATPTDGLGITNSDLEQIGVASYEEVDVILSDWIYHMQGDPSNPVIKRYERTHFKRSNPYNLEIK